MAALSDDEVDRRLAERTGWERDGDAIRRRFKFEDFQASVDFVNRITPAAEEMNHHPDLAISWNTVDCSLSTHSQGGITAADFDLAEQIDDLA
ncbi:MAG: 4a-hydroxytetrahydrobiopterin dehydratase [Thermoleophilaceae bacterium]|jgi:4a-hydroxytetrahydrobiopterin dehydratase|nr:4a-hydroxytetrahydrobiopterin dehydratase [Thermoleophilaceae bacterium]